VQQLIAGKEPPHELHPAYSLQHPFSRPDIPDYGNTDYGNTDYGTCTHLNKQIAQTPTKRTGHQLRPHHEHPPQQAKCADTNEAHLAHAM
jgi:hypothetical protein